MKPETVLWLYLVVLLAGGIFGFVKAKSRISLISALVFGALIALAALGKLGTIWAGDIILTILVGVFAQRFGKTRKFMPAGLMVVLSIAALLIRGMMLWG